MTSLLIFGLLAIAQDCASCGESQVTIRADTVSESQFNGLRQVVESLEAESKTLADQNNKNFWSANNLKDDDQDAVVDLTDSMSDNLLLSRTYLALAIAELKLVQAAERVGRSDYAVRSKYMKHILAIQISIDDRILDRADLRIYRVLQAGVSQALRLEVERLSKQLSVQQSSPNHQIHALTQTCETRGSPCFVDTRCIPVPQRISCYSKPSHAVQCRLFVKR